MTKWQVELIQIGRQKANAIYVVGAESLPAVEQHALDICKTYLKSHDLDLVHKEDLRYGVLADMRTVGTVQIHTL